MVVVGHLRRRVRRGGRGVGGSTTAGDGQRGATLDFAALRYRRSRGTLNLAPLAAITLRGLLAACRMHPKAQRMLRGEARRGEPRQKCEGGTASLRGVLGESPRSTASGTTSTEAIQFAV